MFRVVEAFSGIGSQAKALRNIGVEHEIVATIDWDINAIIAYDIIHHGTPDLSICETMTLDEIKLELQQYTLSNDGKEPITKNAVNVMSENTVKHLWAAIKRSNNLVSITDVRGEIFPNDIDLFTYSFPCQDLSIARAWHGENGGIDRSAQNRSGMLWEVERILHERRDNNLSMPRFLLMENVSNILSSTHIENFNEWKSNLVDMGYFNFVYRLDAYYFGIPQKRTRAYMLSVLCNKEEEALIKKYLEKHDLNDINYVNKIIKNKENIDEIIRLDYSNSIYKLESEENQPNDTPSRTKIYKENLVIYDGNEFKSDYVKTITTKQDRNPNSGIIIQPNKIDGKALYRNLTPRECFMLMGFDEGDYQALIDNNFYMAKNKRFFTKSKLHKMAGNSIVVNVLEEIFKQVKYINEEIFQDNSAKDIEI